MGAVPPEIFCFNAYCILSILNSTYVTFQCYMCNLSANAMIVVIDRSCRENLQNNFCVAAWPICSSVIVTNVFQLGLPTHFSTMRLKVLTTNWMRTNRLQLNDEKTEVMWCASARRQSQLGIYPGFPLSAQKV